MRAILYISVLLALGCSAASASDWVKIGGSPTGVKVYYDRDTATYKEAQVDAWARIVYPAPQPLSGGGGAAAELRTHYLIDCMARTISSTGVEFYDADGTLLRSVVPDAKEEPIAMQTPGGAIGKLFCQNW
jgi:hypothetical protein